MPAMIKLEVQQVKEIIEQFSEEEKLELSLFLNRITIEKFWIQFTESKKDIPITEADILNEVEIVRYKEWENKVRMGDAREIEHGSLE